MKQIMRKEASHLRNKTSTCHPSTALSHPISNIISRNINSPWNQRFHALITVRHCRDGCSREISGSSRDSQHRRAWTIIISLPIFSSVLRSLINQNKYGKKKGKKAGSCRIQRKIDRKLQGKNAINLQNLSRLEFIIGSISRRYCYALGWVLFKFIRNIITIEIYDRIA